MFYICMRRGDCPGDIYMAGPFASQSDANDLMFFVRKYAQVQDSTSRFAAWAVKEVPSSQEGDILVRFENYKLIRFIEKNYNRKTQEQIDALKKRQRRQDRLRTGEQPHSQRLEQDRVGTEVG